MLIRVVRMTFREEETAAFLEIFSQSRDKIRSFPGCRHLELWQDAHKLFVFTTYSLWDSEAALNNYRNSELFTGVWAATKRLFAAQPQAFSSFAIVPENL
jgi:heme oxygenase (mycobilin-producing)